MIPWSDFPHPSPRKWQVEALPKALECIERSGRGVVRAATGAGKSYLIAEICRMRPHDSIVVVTPTTELVQELSTTIEKRCPGQVGQWWGERKEANGVTVVCNPSLPSFSKAYPGGVDVLIIDEAHESECDTFHETLQGFSAESIIGVTATPWRADTSETLSLFENLLYDYGPAQAIRDGVVVPPAIVHPAEGDGENINDIMLAMILREQGPGVVDSKNIADAREFCALLQSEGVRAAIVHSQQKRPARKTIEELEAGKIDVIVHVEMLSRGVDIPCLRWLGCRRRIGSRTLFAQYVGRGLRCYPGKAECRILDPWDLFNVHSLDYEAVLGASQQTLDAHIIKLQDLLEELSHSDAEPETLDGVPVKMLEPSAAYVRSLRHEMEARGVIPFDANPGFWRQDPARPDDVERVGARMRVVNRLVRSGEMPREQGRALWVAYRALRLQNRGTALDLNKILKVLEWKGWPDELRR